MIRMTGSRSHRDSAYAPGPERVLPLGVGLLAGLTMLSILAGCRAQQHFFDTTGELFVLSAAQHYDEAVERARGWRPDAYVGTINASVASSRIHTLPDRRLTYMFDSPSTPDAFYILRFTDEGWTADARPKGPLAVVPLPIERDDWSLDSGDAWSIALANGGEDFLTRHQDPLTAMAVTLQRTRVRGSDNVLVWRVWFLVAPGGPGNRLDMSIDPKTGDILQVIR